MRFGVGRKTAYRNMVRPLSIRGDCDGDTCDAEEHEDQRPPREVGKATVDSRYYGADKGDDPGELLYNVSQRAPSDCRELPDITHNANRYGGQRKGISNDATQAEARRSLAVASVFHFV